METHDLRNLSAPKLQKQIESLENDYHATLEHVKNGKDKNHGALKALRRAVARAKTVATEQRRAALV